MVLRKRTVAVRDLRDVGHSVEVTAETLYEAIATALAALQQDNWAGEIGQGFARVRSPLKDGECTARGRLGEPVPSSEFIV